MSSSDAPTTTSTSGPARFSLEAHFPLELLLYIIGILEPLAYLKLSQTNRSMRQLLKQPEHLRRLIRRPNSKMRKWEARFSDPCWEQLVLRAHLGRRAREGEGSPDKPWRICLSNQVEIAAASIGSSGRYVAFLSTDYEVRMWDLFMHREVHIPLLCSRMWVQDREETNSIDDELGDGHRDCKDLEIELRDDEDLLILKDHNCWGVWDLNDAKRPTFSERFFDRRHHELSSNYTLAVSKGKLAKDRLITRKVGVWNPYGPDIDWRGVEAFATARCSSDMLIYGEEVPDPMDEYNRAWPPPQRSTDRALQHWNLDTQQLVLSKPLAHLQLPRGSDGDDFLLSALQLSDDGTRAVYFDNGVRPRAWHQGPEEPAEATTVLRSWSLSDPEWPVVTFDDELTDVEGLDTFSPDLRFRIAISRHGTIRVCDLSGQTPVFAIRAGTFVWPLLDFGPWSRTVPWQRVRAPLTALLSHWLHSDDPRKGLRRLEGMPVGACVAADGAEIQGLLDAGIEVLVSDNEPVLYDELATKPWNWRLAAVDAQDGWMLTSDKCGPIFCSTSADSDITLDGWCRWPGCRRCDVELKERHG